MLFERSIDDRLGWRGVDKNDISTIFKGTIVASMRCRFLFEGKSSGRSMIYGQSMITINVQKDVIA